VIDQGEGRFSRDRRRWPDEESVINTRLETLRRIVAIIREIEATLEDDATMKRYLANALQAVGFYYALPEDMHDNWWLRVISMPSRVVKNDFPLRISIV
jgi:hypothetical protein